MEYSLRCANTLTRVFLGCNDATVVDVSSTETTLDNHNAFNRLFVIDVSSDEIEVPVFARSAVEHVVGDELESPYIRHASKIVIPMYVNTDNMTARTADNIISIFFSRTNFNRRLQKITTSKGEVYYGGKGIILDKDFNILLLYTIACRRMEYWSRQVMSYYKPVIHVSPQVFLRGDSLINKSILKKVIPFHVSHDVSHINPAITHGFFMGNIPEGTKPQILIDDVSKFIENPAKPTPQKCSDDVLNQILVDNVDDVLNQL
jgi:hypothetical protein